MLERRPPTRIKPYESKKGMKTFNELFFGNLVVLLEARIASSLEKLSCCVRQQISMNTDCWDTLRVGNC